MVAALKLCPDTNVLLRAALPNDDPLQTRLARTLLDNAETVVVSLPVLCEFAWVLRSVYRFSAGHIGIAIAGLLSAGNVVCDRRCVAFGLALTEAGGDFSDGVIAEAGFLAGADRFVSFDQRAVRLLAAAGRDAVVPT